MLKYIRKCKEAREPIGHLSLRLSNMLRYRNINTPEEAERFLHPSLDDLYDPFLMPDMRRAVELLREAVREKKGIVVYGDYDVDGICAASIMLETLREMGAQVEVYIPSRHEEGYGLNETAVRQLAQRAQLLLTVDCGITNLAEVQLAHQLGMTVIVTDHHQLAEKLPQADAVLNPLLEPYPFKRLCGAGVALKLTQALLGMAAVRRRLELAALATVADIVPLVDENRVIVREGMAQMGQTARPGLKRLMQLAQVSPPVNTGHLGFRIAPRLNAGGRLEDALQGVTLLTTQDENEAERIALHLDQLNQARQAMETQIVGEANAAIKQAVNFRTDRAIILMGENWNHGVIGLAAGRICEKYHFPTIVLTEHEGMAVGSCRSIPGVDIHRMLTACNAAFGGHLFERFGGHEQAAGLTMRATLVPELRKLLNQAINANCDLTCYIPAMEYELPVRLADVTMELIEELEQLQPTGYGNPNPVLLAKDVHLQEARRVGATGAHLRLTLLDGQRVLSGIGFQMGDRAGEGLERVDVLFTPEKNEFRGRVTPQMNVRAMIPAVSGIPPVPEEKTIFFALLQELTYLASNINNLSSDAPKTLQESPVVMPLRLSALSEKLRSGRGVLMVAHHPSQARQVLATAEADVACSVVTDVRAFNTVLFAPDMEKLQDHWTDIVLLDGDVLPGEKEALHRACPHAALHALQNPPEALRRQLCALAMADEPLRELYKSLRSSGRYAASALAQASGLTEEQVLVGLTAFAQVELVDFTLEPFALSMRPMHRVNMADSSLVRYLRALKVKIEAD